MPVGLTTVVPWVNVVNSQIFDVMSTIETTILTLEFITKENVVSAEFDNTAYLNKIMKHKDSRDVHFNTW